MSQQCEQSAIDETVYVQFNPAWQLKNANVLDAVTVLSYTIMKANNFRKNLIAERNSYGF